MEKKWEYFFIIRQFFFFFGKEVHKLSRGLYQHENTSSRVIAEVKHLEFNQFSDGSNFVGSGE